MFENDNHNQFLDTASVLASQKDSKINVKWTVLQFMAETG